MKINEKIFEEIKQSKLPFEDVINYLLGLYFNQVSNYFPEDFINKVNILNIYNIDDKGLLEWNISLFETNQETAFKWVETEYVPLFKSANPLRGGHVKESTARMKKFFAENPEVRKEEIIGAVKTYLNMTDHNYIKFPHYFITKGVGDSKVESLYSWVDEYRKSLESLPTTNRNSLQ